MPRDILRHSVDFVRIFLSLLGVREILFIPLLCFVMKKSAMVPVFILGMYRSGTSWLLRSLCAHPAIRGVPELDLVRPTLRTDATEAWHIRPRSEWLHKFFADNRWARLDIVSLLDSRLRPTDDLEAGIAELAEAMGRRFAGDSKRRSRIYGVQ